MSKIEIVEAYQNYGKAAVLSSATHEAVVTLDFGPRIISYKLIGGENILWQDKTGKVLPAPWRYGDRACTLYGGLRLWVAPEIMEDCYYPDNYPCEYEIIGETIKIIPPPQAEPQRQLTLSVSLGETGDLTITVTVTNIGDKPQIVAPWLITQVRNGGTVVAPLNMAQTSPMVSRHVALWPYTDVTDSRLTFKKDAIEMFGDPNAKTACKFGTNPEKAAYYRIDGLQLTLEMPREDTDYPSGVPFESYTEDLFTEVEILGGLKTLEKGQTAALTIVQKLSKI